LRSLFKSLPDLILAEFDSPKDLLHAAEKLRDEGYTKFDSHSPFPIHGMDQAMGLTRSPLGYIIGTMGTIGLLSMVALTYYTNIIGYPMVISGKPYFSWQAFVPVFFAITILLSAFGAFFGMLAINQLPKLFHPLFNSSKFSRVTDGAFFISVQADDPKYDEQTVKNFLEFIGGKNVELIKANE
jgi:hypothetical protein